MDRVINQQDRIYTLFTQLRRRHFAIGIGDFRALIQAVQAGFGISNRAALCRLCCTLWAKSLEEQEILIKLFEQLQFEDWQLSTDANIEIKIAANDPKQPENILIDTGKNINQPPKVDDDGNTLQQEPITPPEVKQEKGLPPIQLSIAPKTRPFIFTPQYPLNYREVAQAWRRLKQQVREGPRIELDLDNTIRERVHSGLVGPVMLRPRRRNQVRLVLLVDRQGTMMPFHSFIDLVCQAITQSGKFKQVEIYYFRDVPAAGVDISQLSYNDGNNSLSSLSSYHSLIPQLSPLFEGSIYADRELLELRSLHEVLKEQVTDAAVCIISDAGVSDRSFNTLRLLDTLAFMKALRCYTWRYVWLNPWPESRWIDTIAGQIARYIPMFTLNNEGIYQAVNVLRGQVYQVERPL